MVSESCKVRDWLSALFRPEHAKNDMDQALSTPNHRVTLVVIIARRHVLSHPSCVCSRYSNQPVLMTAVRTAGQVRVDTEAGGFTEIAAPRQPREYSVPFHHSSLRLECAPRTSITAPSRLNQWLQPSGRIQGSLPTLTALLCDCPHTVTIFMRFLECYRVGPTMLKSRLWFPCPSENVTGVGFSSFSAHLLPNCNGSCLSLQVLGLLYHVSVSDASKSMFTYTEAIPIVQQVRRGPNTQKLLKRLMNPH